MMKRVCQLQRSMYSQLINIGRLWLSQLQKSILSQGLKSFAQENFCAVQGKHFYHQGKLYEATEVH